MSAGRLASDAPARVIRITRIRTRDGAPFIAETITLPEALFPGLVEQRGDRPTRSMTCSRRSYGVLVTRTDDRLSAVAADAETAAALGIRAGHAAAADRPHRLRGSTTRRSNGA